MLYSKTSLNFFNWKNQCIFPAKHNISCFYCYIVRILLFISIIVLFSACKEGKKPETQQDVRKITVEAIKADFETLTKTIETKVPDPFIYTDKNRYDSIKLQISNSIQQDMTVDEVLRLFYPLVKVLNNINYALYLPDSLSTDSFVKYFPIHVLIDSGVVYVNEIDSPFSKGQIIHSINQVSTDSILKLLNAGMLLTDREWEFRYAYLSSVFSRKLYDIIGMSTTFQVGIGDSIYTISGQTIQKIQNAQPMLQFDVWDDSVAYLNVNTFNWGEGAESDSVKVLIRNYFQKLTDEQVPYLIIDIRGVMKGNPAVVTELLDYLTEEPYNLSLKTRFFLHKQMNDAVLPPHQPDYNKLNYKGKVVLLSDILTSGSGHMMQVAFQYYQLGFSIGQPSIYGNIITGQEQEQLLRHSGIEFTYPTVTYILPGFDDSTSLGYYIPNLVIRPSRKNSFNGKDVMIEAAIQSLKSPAINNNQTIDKSGKNK